MMPISYLNAASPNKPHNAASAILADVNVRRAIAHCTNRQALAASVFPFLNAAQLQTLLMDSFVPKTHWAYSDAITKYSYDPIRAAQLLDGAGWTLSGGNTYRKNTNGQELALSYKTTNAAFRQTYGNLWATQLSACGIRMIPTYVSASIWFGANTGLRIRDFETGALAWVTETDPRGQSLFGCDYIPTPSNSLAGQNYVGWCNKQASKSIGIANRDLVRSARIEQYAIFQQQFAKDVTHLPVFQRVDVSAAVNELIGFTPNSTEYATWNAHTWKKTGLTTLIMGITREPSTLSPKAESSPAISLIYGHPATMLSYDFQSLLFASLPSIENGGVVTRSANVSDGTRVMNANNSVVTLTLGTNIVNAAGQIVTYTGGIVSMTQMIITATYRNGLKWSNGTNLVQADLKLWDKITCDPTVAGNSPYDCQRVANRIYVGDTSAVYTLIPGDLPPPPTHISFLPSAYPSQRIISDGRKLEDVPASEWSTLPEIAVSPIGLGPYQITSWAKGQRMTFTANPHFALGLAQTPNLEVKFFGDESLALSELKSGQIHILYNPSGGATASEIMSAADSGQIQAFIVPSVVWEDILLNLPDLPSVAVTYSSTVAMNGQTVIDVLADFSVPLRVTGYSQGIHGTVNCLVSGLCTYTPVSNFSGTDSFTYTVSTGSVAASNVQISNVANADLNGIVKVFVTSRQIFLPIVTR